MFLWHLLRMSVNYPPRPGVWGDIASGNHTNPTISSEIHCRSHLFFLISSDGQWSCLHARFLCDKTTNLQIHPLKLKKFSNFVAANNLPLCNMFLIFHKNSLKTHALVKSDDHRAVRSFITHFASFPPCSPGALRVYFVFLWPVATSVSIYPKHQNKCSMLFFMLVDNNNSK